MPVHNLNMADENLIEEITDMDTLLARVPRFEQFFDAVKDLESFQAANSKAGELSGRTGFTIDKSLQWIARVPISVACAVKEIDPMFWRDPVKVGKFLKKHPEYCVTRVIR